MIDSLAGPPGVILFATATILLTALLIAAWRKGRVAGLAARAAEARAKAAEQALAAAPVGCLAFSQPGEAVSTSPNLVRSLGIDRRNLALTDVLDAFDPTDAAVLAEAIEHLRERGEGFSVTLRTKAGDHTFEVLGTRAQAVSVGEATDFVWFHDITRLHGQLVAARRDRDIHARLLDTLPVPIWRRDRDLTLTYCNNAYAQALDMDRAAAVADAVELIGKAQAGRARKLAEKARAAGKAVAERHHIVIGGARRLFEIEERPLDEAELAGYAVDRTDAEELDRELKRHISAHADVLESLGSAIAIFGSDLHLQFFNTAYAQLWQLDDDFLNTHPTLADILEALREARRLPEQANFPEYKREWLRSLQTLIEPREELQHLPDGSTLRSVASPHPFGGVLLTYEDVTDRLTLERSYNTLIEVQRETLDNLYEGVAVYGADGRLKLSNPAFERIWGLQQEALDNQPHVRELMEERRDLFEVPDSDWPGFRETRVALTTEPETRSGRRARADSTVVDWAQVPLPDGASLFTFLDVTDSHRVERALRERNEALETTDRLKSEFIANISYELRTPLNAIVGFAEILENQFFGTLNDRQLEYSRGIVEASKRLTALINDILDLATIEAGYMELEVDRIDVRELLHSIQVLGQERARWKDIALEIACPEEIGEVVADSRRLRQALFNLLSNAFNFTPEKGTVTIQAERRDKELLLSVTDTGAGIRTEDLNRVFAKFERGPAPAGQSGAGLGLSLVKSLIELHGGYVELKSTPGQGTCVTCHVPAIERRTGGERQPLTA